MPTVLRYGIRRYYSIVQVPLQYSLANRSAHIEIVDLKGTEVLTASSFVLHSSLKLKCGGEVYTFKIFAQSKKVIACITESRRAKLILQRITHRPANQEDRLGGFFTACKIYGKIFMDFIFR